MRTKSVRVCPSYALVASDEGERERKESLKASCKERESPSPNASRNILTRPLSLPRPSNHLTTAPPSQFFPHCDIHYPSAISSSSSCFEATRRRRRREPLASHYSPARTPEPFRFAIRTVPLFQESPRTGANFLVRILGKEEECTVQLEKSLHAVHARLISHFPVSALLREQVIFLELQRCSRRWSSINDQCCRR